MQLKSFIATLFFLAVSISANCAETLTTIWEGETAMGNWSQQVYIDAQKFANVENWNFIRVTVSDIDPAGINNWPQFGVKINTEGWPALDGTANAQVTAPGTYDFLINKYGAEDLKTYGAVLHGAWAVITKVEILSGFEPEYPDAVWLGPVDMGSSWGVWASLDHSCFKRANVGDIIRFYISDLRAGASGIMQYSASDYSWKQFDGVEFTQLSGGYFEYEITASMLPILQGLNDETGIIVTGINYTLDAMTILGPEYSSDALKLTVDHSNLVFVNETPVIKFSFSFNNELQNQDEFAYKIDITTDKMEPVTSVTGTTTTTNAAVELPFDADEDFGVFRYTIYVSNILGESYNFVLNPEKIKPEPDAQPDFDQFWAKAKSDLAAVAPEYTMTLLPQLSGSVRDIYLVEMKSVSDGDGEPVIVRGHYAKPKKEGTFPCIVSFQGYDGGGDVWPPSGNSEGDWCEFVLSTRGQVLNNRPPYENTYGDWFAYGFDNKDHYYYRGAFMDAVRAIDFVCSQPEVQSYNVFAQGQSQGGALTIAAAALSDGRINAIAPAVQFLGDYPNYFQVASWPASVAFACQKQYGMTDEEMYAMLSYFDTKNLAPMVAMPAISSMGLQDNVCPLRTNLAAYNNFASEEKEYVINVNLGHQVAGSWYNTYMSFFKKHLKTGSGIESVKVAEDAEGAAVYYNLQGQKVANPQAGAVYIRVYPSGKAEKIVK